MIHITMQYFGGQGASSGKSGGGKNVAAYTLRDMMNYKINLLNYKAEREAKGKSTKMVEEELAEVNADIKKAREALKTKK